MNEEIKLLDVLRHKRMLAQLADYCEVTRTAPHKWLARGSVPSRYRGPITSYCASMLGGAYANTKSI